MLRFEEDLSIAPVHNISHTCQACIGLLYKIDDLEDRSAGGHNVFNDEHPLPGMNFKAAPELHLPVNPLREDCPNTQHSADLSADNDAANGRRYHKFHVSIFEVLRDLAAQEMQIFGVLQDPGALKVLWAVESGRELKMPFEEGLRLAKDVENLFFWEFHGA
jgi:hypothetical protein